MHQQRIKFNFDLVSFIRLTPFLSFLFHVWPQLLLRRHLKIILIRSNSDYWPNWWHIWCSLFYETFLWYCFLNKFKRRNIISNIRSSCFTAKGVLVTFKYFCKYIFPFNKFENEKLISLWLTFLTPIVNLPC